MLAWKKTDNNLILLKLIPYWVCGVEKKNVRSDLEVGFSEILFFKWVSKEKENEYTATLSLKWEIHSGGGRNI